MNKITELIHENRSSLMRYACYRLGDADDAKDVVQDLYLKLYSRYSEDGSGDVKNWKHYAFRTLSNLCADRLRSAERQATLHFDEHFDVADIPDEDNETDITRITQLLAAIPKEQAEVIRLRIYGNNSFAEVAAILSIPLSTVKSRFLYGLEKIRQAMK